jgi:hypothetical protein
MQAAGDGQIMNFGTALGDTIENRKTCAWKLPLGTRVRIIQNNAGFALSACGNRQCGRVAPDPIRTSDTRQRRNSMNRDEYVERMKKQIDEWNAKLAKWQAEVQKAQANVKVQYEAQIKTLEKHRDEAVKRLNETRDASHAAWMEVSKGTERAWKTMQSSFEKAWEEFHKKKS